ncbi:MAG: SIS domain-containing protein [Candidatus Hadarchaeia archaeon]
MNDYFTDISEVYEEGVNKISSYPSKEEEKDYKRKSEKFIDMFREAERVIWVGTGRQEEVADFATRITKSNDKDTFCSKDSSIPYKYREDDLVVALSSSGETTRTIHYAESAYNAIKKSTPVIAITTDPNSTLAQIAEKTDGFVVEIPGRSKKDRTEYQERQFSGHHEPLTLGGTLGELYTLEFILDSIGGALSHQSVIDYHNKFWEEIKRYKPDPKKISRFYEMLPEPIAYNNSNGTRDSANKTIIGGMGLSGVVARAFAIRLAHCAREKEERRVNYYKDAGITSVRKNDLAFIISGSGQKFWAEALKPIKERGGNIVSATSFKDSPLGKISDLCIEIPGRKKIRDSSKVENPPKNPERAMFEIRFWLTMETFIHSLVEGEKISLKAVEEKHPQIT